MLYRATFLTGPIPRAFPQCPAPINAQGHPWVKSPKTSPQAEQLWQPQQLSPGAGGQGTNTSLALSLAGQPRAQHSHTCRLLPGFSQRSRDTSGASSTHNPHTSFHLPPKIPAMLPLSVCASGFGAVNLPHTVVAAQEWNLLLIGRRPWWFLFPPAITFPSHVMFSWPSHNGT